MIRRRFLALSCGWMSSATIAIAEPERLESGRLSNFSSLPDDPDFTLRIGAVTWDLAPKRSIKTLG